MLGRYKSRAWRDRTCTCPDAVLQKHGRKISMTTIAELLLEILKELKITNKYLSKMTEKKCKEERVFDF